MDVPRTSKVMDVKLGGTVESITIEIGNPEGRGRHIRHVSYWREPDLYVIRDTVEEFEGCVLFSLPVASRRSSVQGSRVYSEGFYGMDLETVFLRPLQRLRLEQGRTTPFFGSDEETAGRDGRTPVMDYIRAEANGGDGFLTVLYPKEREKPRLVVRTEADGTVLLRAEDRLLRLDVPADGYGVSIACAE